MIKIQICNSHVVTNNASFLAYLASFTVTILKFGVKVVPILY